MPKDKLERYSEVTKNPYVIEHSLMDDSKDFIIKNWRKDYFKNNNPICLELGCGRGEYTIALARRNPNINYIGIDIKGARLWKGASIAEEEKLKNVAFLRIQIEHILNYFPEQIVDEIWITFPDPYLRESRAKKRLSSVRFLGLYKQILKENAFIHLKTDEVILYEFTLETLADQKHHIIEHSDNLYQSDLVKKYPELVEIQTKYEQTYLRKGKAITYIRFSLKN
jgi:tRNA (guanine-N7-)-methyltransferase